MARVSGLDASITFNNGYVLAATSWTINMVAEEVEATALGESWKTFLNGVKEWSGSYTALIEPDSLANTSVGDAGGGGSSFLALGADAAQATFYAEGGTDGFQGTIFITGIDATATVGGTASNFTFTFRGTADLQYIT